MSTYKQCFWTVQGVEANAEGDIGADRRQKILSAALTVQQDNDDIVLVSMACGGWQKSEMPEISLLVALGDFTAFKARVDGLTTSLDDALTDEFSDVDDTVSSTLLDDVRVMNLTTEEVANFIDMSPKPSEALSALLRTAAELPFRGFSSNTHPGVASHADRHHALDPSSSGHDDATPLSGIPPHQILQPFSVNHDVFNKLLVASGSVIQEQLMTVLSTLTNITLETSTSAAVLEMIQGGIITVGTQMWDAYQKVAPAVGAADLTVVLPSVISSIGGMPAVVGVLAAIQATLMTASVFLKTRVLIHLFIFVLISCINSVPLI